MSMFIKLCNIALNGQMVGAITGGAELMRDQKHYVREMAKGVGEAFESLENPTTLEIECFVRTIETLKLDCE